jgi:hypothetical protein
MPRTILCPVLFCLIQLANAQHPLVGTWEMVSVKGINAEGEPFYRDTTMVRETKVITPTHYILIATDVVGDSLAFNRSYAGTVSVEGERYIETPFISSLPIFENVKTDYSWRLEGDRFIQSGVITRPDGKKILLEALIFRRVKSKESYPDNPAIGTWNQVSSTYTDFDGSIHSHTSKTAQRLHVITPTHWMRISQRGNKFEHAMMGTYSMVGKSTIPVMTYSSVGTNKGDTMTLREKIKGNKLMVHGELKNAAGGKFVWDDVFDRLP